MYEMLRHFQTVFRIAKNRVAGNVYIGERDAWMVGRHVEGPQIFLDFETFAPDRNDKAGDAPGGAVASAGAGEHEVMRRDVQPAGPYFCAVDAPAVALANAARLHPGGV